MTKNAHIEHSHNAKLQGVMRRFDLVATALLAIAAGYYFVTDDSYLWLFLALGAVTNGLMVRFRVTERINQRILSRMLRAQK